MDMALFNKHLITAGLFFLVFASPAFSRPLTVQTEGGRGALIGNARAEESAGMVHVAGFVARKRHSHVSMIGSHLHVFLFDSKASLLEEKILPVDSVRLGNTDRGFMKTMPFAVDFPRSAPETVLIRYEK